MNIIPQPSAFAATRRRLALPVASLFAALALTQSVSATSLYWDGNGITAGAGNTTALLNKIWGTDSMWNSDAAGVTNTFTSTTTSADDLFFVAGPSATSGNIAFNPTVTGTQAANSITFQNQGALTLSGGAAINLGAGGLVGAQFAYGSTARGAVTISSPIALQATQSWINNGTAAMTVSGAVSGTGDLTIQNTAAGTFTISTGGINNTGAITNSGSGAGTTTISGVIGAAVMGITQNSTNSALTLSGANIAYAGATTLTSGTLNVNNSKALGLGSLVINGGSLNSSGINALSNTAYTAGTSGGGSSTVPLTNTSGLSVGQFVYGAGVGSGAYITAISANTSITLSTPNTAVVTGTALTFGALVPQTWTSDFTYTGTGNLNLGSGAISLGANAGATRTVTVTANTLTVGGAISSGTNGVTPTINLTKDGAGTLALTGTDMLGYTGATTVSLGTLAITGANTSYVGATTLTSGTLRLSNPTNTNVLTSLGSSNIALNGGTLQLRGNGTGSSQNIVAGNNVTMGSGAATIDVNVFGSTTNTSNSITLGNLSLGTGQLNVTGGNSYTLRFSGTTTLTSNTIFNATTGGLSLVGVVGESGGSYSITKDGSGALTLSGNNAYSGITLIKAGTININTSVNALGTGTSDILLGDTTGSASATLNISNGTSYTLARNITVQAGNTGTATLGGSTGISNTDTYSGIVTLGSGVTGHGLTIAQLGGNGYNTTSVTGKIQDPAGLIGTAGVLTIAGSNVVLSGTNTYTGGTVLNTGNLKISNTQALGLGYFTINGGSLSQTVGALTGITGQTWAGDFNISATSGSINLGTSAVTLTGSRFIVLDNGTATVGGVISGAGFGLTLKGTQYTGNFILNGLNTYSGGTTVAGTSASFTVQSGSATGLGTGQTRLTNSTNSKVGLSADTTIESLTSGISELSFGAGTGGTNGTQALVFSGGGGTGAAGTATISGGIVTAVTITDYGQGYTSAPTISITNGGTNTASTAFGSSSFALGTKTLTLAGTNASPATYAGIISGTGGSLIKNGSGTQILTGANSYTGSTTVSGGVLNISGAGTIAGTSGVTVSGGDFSYNSSTALSKTIALNSGTVSGTGNLSGAITVTGGLLTNIGTAGASSVTLNAGGGINPANTGVAGTFTSNSLTWNSDNSTSGLRFDLGLNTAASDQISLTGTFNKGTGSTFVFNFNDLGIQHSFSYTLLTFAGGSSGFSAGDFSATGIAGTFVLNSGDLSFLTAAAVPEPATYAAILGALALVGAVYRRRRSRNA